MISRQMVQRAAFASVGAVSLALAASGWRWVSLRSTAADLKLQIVARSSHLAEDRRTATTMPTGPRPAALDRSKAVSRFREVLGALTAKNGCVMEDFQASTEETPYVTAYASDSQDPGWVQVSVRVQLNGASTAVMAAVAGLRTLDVPFEIDTLELTRKSTDKKGMATVGTAIGVRVLVYRGEG